MELPASDESRIDEGALDRPALTPRELDCASCGYALGGMPIRRCPECGGEFGDEEIDACNRRVRAMEQLPALVRRNRIVLGNGVGLVTALALLVTGDLVAAAVVFALSAGVGFGSWAVGWAAAETAGKASCGAVRVAWTKNVLYFNAPWLLSPLVLVVFLVSSFLVRWLGNEGSRMITAAIASTLIIGLWAICGMRCLVLGGDRFNGSCDAFGTRTGAWQGFVTLIILGTSLVSIVLSVVLVFGGLNELQERQWFGW